MFRLLLFATFLLINSLNLGAQDLIILKSGREVQGKITEITGSEIKYKKQEFLDGPSYILSLGEVFMVQYSNGEKEYFRQSFESVQNEIDFQAKGISDANLYYTGKNSGAVWTGAAAFFFSPLLGLIPAIACSVTPPTQANLNMPRSDYREEDEYIEAYEKQAHKIKKRKVWTGYGIGAGALIFLVVLL